MKQEKATAVAELTEAFRGATAALLTEYRGLSMAQLTALRKQLGTGTRYKVTKNTLTKLAAQEAGFGDLDAWLSGPTAVAFVSGDPVEAAKGLRDFAKTNPALVIKGGVFEGKTLDADAVRKIADLESREVLLAKLAGAMNASTAKAAALFQAPLTKAAQLAAALQEKLAAEAAEGTATAETPAES